MNKWIIYSCSLLLIANSCKKADKGCLPSDVSNPMSFAECQDGSGNFGRWIVDEYRLPAYEYTLNQEKDARALWWNSAQEERREHWHQIGNLRFSATANNDGVVQVFVEENGYKWLNYFNESEKNYSGAFAFIDDGEEIWSTSYRYRPEGAKTKRIFGMGYFQTDMEHRGLKVRRTTYAPYGDDPVLLSDITITNNTGERKEIDYYEYWDVNIHHMLMMLLSSGVLNPEIPLKNEAERNAFNRYFIQSAKIEDSFGAGVIETSLKYPEASELKIPLPGSPKEFDDSPPSIFLVPLDGEGGEGFIFDQNRFFGNGDAGHVNPEGLEIYKDNSEIPEGLKNILASGQPLMLIHKRHLIIEAGLEMTLRYAYGYLTSSNTLDFINNYKNLNNNYLLNSLDNWRGKLAYFSPERDFFLHREIAWHSYYLQSASYWREYLKTHIISQGGEYLFGHGFDGATRDYCIFSVPLSYINPGLAKEVLRFVMLTTMSDGEMAYGNYGDTIVTGVVILSQPSDLDIFFLWAIAEYLLATGDLDFLDEVVPFYKNQGIFDSPSTTTVLDHIRIAFDHLVNVVGTGEHGLIRLRTGDWSDGITWFTEDPSLTEEKGESTFNTAFASVVLPIIAEAISSSDRDLSQRMLEQAQRYKDAMMAQWGGQWYYRGWQGNGKPFGHDRIFLEPQVWSLIGRIPDSEKTAILINSIYTILDANSPAGARIVFPPKENIFGGLSPGTDVNGGIWHAINSFLTWAYSLYNPEYAWESFKKNTLASHAEAYPDIWYGIWSGPDSYNSPESERPGETAAHYATALTDHPVMNMNQHANPLIALIKLAGIIPSKEGITIMPRFPFRRWAIHLPLLGIKYEDNSISGYYNRKSAVPLKISVWLPDDFLNIPLKLKVNKEAKALTIDGNTLSFIAESDINDRIEWEIWKE